MPEFYPLNAKSVLVALLFIQVQKTYINKKGKKLPKLLLWIVDFFALFFLKVVFWLHSTGNCNAPTLNQQKWELCEKESSSLIGGDVANQRAALAADRPRNHSLSSAYNLCCLGQKGGNWVKWTLSNLHFVVRTLSFFMVLVFNSHFSFFP